MARKMKKSRYRLMGLGEALIFWVASSADPLAHQVDHPFRNVAAWLRQVRPCLENIFVEYFGFKFCRVFYAGKKRNENRRVSFCESKAEI